MLFGPIKLCRFGILLCMETGPSGAKGGAFSLYKPASPVEALSSASLRVGLLHSGASTKAFPYGWGLRVALLGGSELQATRRAGIIEAREAPVPLPGKNTEPRATRLRALPLLPITLLGCA